MPSCWDNPGWIWLFQIALLTLVHPHIYFSPYFSQIFSAQENETGFKEWGHWRCTKLPWDEWLGIRVFYHGSRLRPMCRAVCKGAKRFQTDQHRSWNRLLIPSLRRFSWHQTNLFAQDEQITSSHRHLKEKYSKETPALRLTGTSWKQITANDWEVIFCPAKDMALKHLVLSKLWVLQPLLSKKVPLPQPTAYLKGV